MDIPAWERGLRFLRIMKKNIPAAVHSIVVQTPSGRACTHRFATESVDLPAQEGERVTIALASNVSREVVPLKFKTKATNFYRGGPLCLTNHINGRESPLLRAPIKDGSASPFLNKSIFHSVGANRSSFDQIPQCPQRPIFVIGDSSVDCGTNNFLCTFALADRPPYAVDFDTHRPTGRFSNGRIPVDYLELVLFKCQEDDVGGSGTSWLFSALFVAI